MILSVGDLQNFRTCRRKAHRVLMLPRTESSGPARVGQAAHRIASEYVLRLYREKRDSDFDFARELIKGELARLDDSDSKDLDSFIWDFVTLLDTKLFSGGTSLIAEKTRRCRIEDARPCDGLAGGTTLRHTEDLTWQDGTTLHVLDWKSGRIVDLLDHPRDNHQLLTYGFAMAMRCIPLPENVELHLYHMRYNLLESHTVTLDKLAEHWQAWVRPAAEAFSAEQDFALTLGPHCAECPVRMTCDGYLATATDAYDDADDADVMNIAGVARAREGDAIDELYRRVAANGPVATEDYCANIVNKVRRDYKPEALAAAMRDYPEEDVAKAFKPTHQSIMRMLRKWHGQDAKTKYDEKFAPLCLERVSSEVRLSKRRREEIGDDAREDG